MVNNIKIVTFYDGLCHGYLAEPFAVVSKSGDGWVKRDIIFVTALVTTLNHLE